VLAVSLYIPAVQLTELSASFYGVAVRGSVTVHMAASADEIWALVSDVTQIGKYSPETFEPSGSTMPPARRWELDSAAM
jgi:hypothetical protein